jgi:hypothetical protein
MISVAKEGGTIINYSSRFTMTGMVGVTPPQYQQAAVALGGSTKGPPTVNSVANNAAPAPGAVGVPGADQGVPYGQQSGPTKYAPMQPVPPTKITQKNPTPLNPTSAFTIATTFLPNPTIATTITAAQTFKVSSIENTVSSLRFVQHYKTLRADLDVGCCCVAAFWRHGQIPGKMEGLSEDV